METVTQQQGVLATIRHHLERAPADGVLRANICRHCEHLEGLASTLRSLGMGEHEIDVSVLRIFHAYERELTSYISRV